MNDVYSRSSTPTLYRPSSPYRSPYKKDFYNTNEEEIAELFELLRTNKPEYNADRRYRRFVNSLVHKRHAWGQQLELQPREWKDWVIQNQIDYRCHPFFRRNICLRAYNESGKLMTAEEIVTLYHQGITSFNRLLQVRNKDRVTDYRFVLYNIQNPMA